MYSQVTNIVLFGFSAFIAAFTEIAILRRHSVLAIHKSEDADLFGGTLIFLLRNGLLVDANFSARRLLGHFGSKELDIGALMRALHASFDDAKDLITNDGHCHSRSATSRDGCVQAIAETAAGSVRLKLSSRAQPKSGSEDLHFQKAQDDELKTLRETSELAPYLVWREAPDGTPIWVNRAYHSLVQQTFGAEREAKWPLPQLFESLQRGAPSRVSLMISGEEHPRWFECHQVPIGKDSLFTAFDANSTVRAETQLRDFMQTLTKRSLN